MSTGYRKVGVMTSSTNPNKDLISLETTASPDSKTEIIKSNGSKTSHKSPMLKGDLYSTPMGKKPKLTDHTMTGSPKELDSLICCNMAVVKPGLPQLQLSSTNKGVDFNLKTYSQINGSDKTIAIGNDLD